MEKSNEIALADLVAETLPVSTFDNYGNMPQEEIDDGNARAIASIKVIQAGGEMMGETLTIQKERFLRAFPNNSEEANKAWLEWAKEWCRCNSKQTVYNFMRIYRVSKNVDPVQLAGLTDGDKIAELDKLPPELQKETIERLPLQEMSRNNVREATKQIKKDGEISEELLKEINNKLQQKTDENKTLQQTTKQKDQEILELKSKLKELEETKMQQVTQVEPEVVEKIVEVEKVVEKEVVPKEIEEELKTLKQLVKERNEVPEHIKNELYSLREQVAEKDALLNDAKETVEAIATATNSKFGTQKVDWNLLGDVVSHFLSGASEYSFMGTVYKEETTQKREYVKVQVEKIEKWVLQMKQMMNESLTIGDAIYTSVDYKIEDVVED